MSGTKVKIILCSPGDKAEGGIPAVVYGLCKVFEEMGVTYKRLVYAKPKKNLSIVTRLYYEFKQLLQFIYNIMVFNPSLIIVETSFDKKTVVRDSVHLWISIILRKKFVIHAHGGEWNFVGGWPLPFRKYTTFFLRKCSGIIVTSNEEYQIIRQNNWNSKTFKLNNPVILPIDIDKLGEKVPSKKLKIIFASRLIESKGIMDLLNAIKLIDHDFELNIYGGGVLYDQCKQFISENGLKSKVFLRGGVSLKDLLLEYYRSDIFVFPSFHLEGFPMAFFYALSCSLSVVCTKVRPLPDFLKEPDNCLWAEAKNPQTLSEKISILLDNESIRQEMSKNNYELSKLFSVNSISKDVNGILSAILTG